jgi:putative transposase
MQLTYDFIYKDKNNLIFNWLKANTNLWNEAVAFSNNFFIINKKYPSYNDLYEHFKNSIFYKNSIKAQAAQQTLKLVEKSFKSYKQLNWLYNNSNLLKGKPNPPQITNKLMTLTFTNQCSTIKNNEIYFTKDDIIKIPQIFNNKFNQIKIKHITKNIYKIIIVYEANITNPILNPTNLCSIDLGVNKLVTLVSNTNNNPRLYSGKIIKSFSHFYSKQIKNKKNKKKFSMKKTAKINDYIHKVSRDIINHCITNKIATIVIGYNDDWQNQSRMGKKNNFFFCSMPYKQLIDKIKYKADLAGIKIELIEESYTSKCDYLANELIQKHDIYLGQRIKTGLFQSSLGKVINADVNSAANIMKKFVIRNGLKVNLPDIRSDKGCLFQPIKVNVLKHLS